MPDGLSFSFSSRLATSFVAFSSTARAFVSSPAPLKREARSANPMMACCGSLFSIVAISVTEAGFFLTTGFLAAVVGGGVSPPPQPTNASETEQAVQPTNQPNVERQTILPILPSSHREQCANLNNPRA